MGEPISPSADDLEGLPQGGLAGLIAKGRAQGSLTTGDDAGFIHSLYGFGLVREREGT